MNKEEVQELKEGFDCLLGEVLIQMGKYIKNNDSDDAGEVFEKILEILSARDEIIAKFNSHLK